MSWAPGVGMPQAMKLEQFGRLIWETFGHTAYHVGSSLKGKEWRDVDVRLILPDDEFERICGELTKPRCMNLTWNGLCLAFAALARDMTGLPVDFQIDQMTQANEEFGGQPRSALGMVTSYGAQRQAEVRTPDAVDTEPAPQATPAVVSGASPASTEEPT